MLQLSAPVLLSFWTSSTIYFIEININKTRSFGDKIQIYLEKS